MTYKHMKFKDSIVMQSLEKLAVQKGLVKPEAMKVEASATKTEKKSESFTENLLLLCNKLRSQGFAKYASELETKFLNLKQAEAKLYDITGEKGEDLIDFAHPKGGIKLDQDWDDLGTVETVSEQHDKILNVVHKPVKGKLEAKDAINAVKVVLALAGGATEEEQLNDLAHKDFLLSKNIWDKIDEIVRKEGGLSKLPFGRFLDFATTSKDIKSILSKSNPGKDDVNDVAKKINDIYQTISPGITGGVNENVWSVIEPMFGRFSKLLSDAMQHITRRNELRTKRELGEGEVKAPGAQENPNVLTLTQIEQRDSALTPLFGRVEKLKKQLQTFKNLPSIARHPEALKWIDEELSDVNKLDSLLDKIPEEQAEIAAPDFERSVSEEEAAVQEFINGWIKPNNNSGKAGV